MGDCGPFGRFARISLARMDPLRQLFALLSSLKLAVVLLVLLLFGLSAGTIVESRAGVETAGRLVYYSWWFLALQGTFAINVAASIANLFPWGKKRVGFVLTHASLLLIFAGSAVTYFFKVEGSLGLWEGESGSVIESRDKEGKVVARHQLPFSVKLDDFVLETYPGTMRPSGFLSKVEVTDTDSGQSFPARIFMNHELHHRGYALFQSSYRQEGGREATVLSVAKDPGQNIVFAGYVALVLGMIVVLFTRIGQAGERAAPGSRPAPAGFSLPSAPRALSILLAVGAAALASGAALGGAATAVPTGNPELLRRIPVQHDGRTMPLDTLARETVWKVTGSHGWQGEDPVSTFAGWLFDPRSALEAPVVRLGSRELAEALGLPRGTSHDSFIHIVQNPQAMKLVESADQAAAQERPRTGLLQEAEKLEQRLLAMQSVIERQAVRPIPVPRNPNARWGVPAILSPDSLTFLATGPRPEGWPAPEKIDREIFYNQLNPVRLSWIVLLGSLVVSIVAARLGSRSGLLLDRAAFVLLLAGFGTMTWGIGLRWAAGERIPAANMYESMLFLAWGVGLFAVVAYALLRNRVVVSNAAVMAALTMALADLLPIDRFIHPIAPVLAGTPWLAIHVPIIMVGYAVLALGLVVAHMQIGVSIFAPARADLAAKMYELLYWYMFVGSIFLLAGILTGSMWAASSWGRYWGWDPKEVWSLVGFLAYMAILHLKVDKVIGTFGVAVVSIAAFQTIVMTYLGVNFVLGSGMHAYGAGDSPVVKWMLLVAAAEAAFLAWGIVAHRRNLGRPGSPAGPVAPA